MRWAALLALGLLAGCVDQTSVHHVAVDNGTSAALDVSVQITDTVTRAAEFGHLFLVQPGQTLSLDHVFRQEREYLLEASTLDSLQRVNSTFSLPTGSWWITVHVAPDGRLSVSTLQDE